MPSTVAELTAELKLNNANFKKGLTATQRALKNFQNQVSQIKNLLISAFTITAAVRTFKKAIDSTQSSGDAFRRTMSAADEATRSLLASVATGDFSGLVQNLKNAAKAGREFADAMDEVSDRTRSIRIQTALAEAKVYKLREIATDTSRTDQERVEAYREIQRILSQQLKIEKQIAEDALQAQIDKQVTRNGLTKEQGELIKEFVTNYEQLTGNELKSVRTVEDLQTKLKNLVKAQGSAGAAGTVSIVGAGSDKYAAQIRETRSELDKMLGSLTPIERKYLDISAALNKLTDEERDAIGNVIIQSATLERKLQSLQNEAIRGIGSIEKKGQDAQSEMAGLNSELEEVEEWMTKPFWQDISSIQAKNNMSQSAADGKSAFQELVDALNELDDLDAEDDLDGISNAAAALGKTVGVMLVQSFDSLGNAIAKSLSGAEGALKDLGTAILNNLGNILIMAGLQSGNIPLMLLGAGIQLGSGILGGLGDRVDAGRVSGNSYTASTLQFKMSGRDMVAVMERNKNYYNQTT